MKIKIEDIKDVEVNEVTKKLTVTFACREEGRASEVEELTLSSPNKEITADLFRQGFEVMGSFDGEGLTLGNFKEKVLNPKGFPAFNVTFGGAESKLFPSGSPRELAKRYHRLRFPSFTKF